MQRLQLLLRPLHAAHHALPAAVGGHRHRFAQLAVECGELFGEAVDRVRALAARQPDVLAPQRQQTFEQLAQVRGNVLDRRDDEVDRRRFGRARGKVHAAQTPGNPSQRARKEHARTGTEPPVGGQPDPGRQHAERQPPQHPNDRLAAHRLVVPFVALCFVSIARRPV